MAKIPKQNTQFQKLQEADVRHFSELIHDQNAAWLIKHFSKRADEYPVNVSMLMRNIIWQMRERIQNKQKPKFSELIRTFWYMYIKPTLARANALSSKRDQYDDLSNAFVEMVTKYNLLTYKDIGFRDENATMRRIGLAPHIILFSEKQGHWSFIQSISKQYGISAISLGGQPSLLSSEYFVDELLKTGVHLNKSFFTFSLVDYDPSGWIIRDAFLDNLRFYGIKNITNTDLIHPDMLTETEIESAKYPIPTPAQMQLKNAKWFDQIAQQDYQNQKHLRPKTNLKTNKTTYYGLEAEAVSIKRLSQKLEERFSKLVGKSETQLKIEHLTNLNTNLKELALLKLTL